MVSSRPSYWVRTKNSLAKTKGALVWSLLVVIMFIGYLQILAPWTPPGNALDVLRAITDVAGVLLGLAGIMFGNMLLVVSQDISEGRRRLGSPNESVGSAGPLNSLEQYRRELVDSMLVVFVFFVLAIAFSLSAMTQVTEPSLEPPLTVLVNTIYYLGISLYWLVGGIGAMMISLRRLPTSLFYGF